ncbi:dihydrolipoamide dehydrogenase [Acinetobacter calcoaceticus]|uniref:Dihydrolipoamide dehydrogenase n=1 Tax=Acinetobacter calcoaceticus TaxID=471 RepID=A0A4R1XVX1_ACICA|nr:dihydrolipoamide dehydrogenase [Acinetobacter calcoaceticus]
MYDIIIIGAGTAGISAYKEAVKYTKNILIINQGPWDTTCARVGCMPSKVLISSANRAYDIQHADEVALKVEVKIDTSAVMTHLRQLRDRFTAATMRDVDSWPSKHKISGTAHFIDAETVQVNDQQYQAKAFILAVGSTPNIDPEWKHELQDRYITSDQVFELKDLPKSMAVIGSGVIAIELAQAMTRLGVETTVFARSHRVGALTSPALQQLACSELAQVMNIKFGILPKQVKRLDHTIEIQYQDKGLQSIDVDYVLSATGRSSNLSSLDLLKIDQSFSDLKTLPVDSETKQLANYPIFIVGDAFTETPLQHEAAIEGKLVVHNCLNFPKISNIRTLTPLSIVFSAPEMVIAGQSHKQLSAGKVNFITGKVSYENQGRARVLGKNLGAAEVYIDEYSRRLLGAELLVESAEHMGHLLSWMISEDVTVDEIVDKPYYHPTLEEGLRTALKHARRQLTKPTVDK